MNTDPSAKNFLEKLRTDKVAQFQALADHLDRVFWISTPAGDDVLYVSPAFEKLWGRDFTSLQKDTGFFLGSIHSEDRGRVSQKLAERQKTKQWDVTYRIVRPDNSIRWVRDIGSPIYNDQGVFVAMAGVVRDVTDEQVLKEHTAHLESDLRKFQKTVESVADAVIITDAGSEIVYVNEAWELLSGYTFQEVVGRNPSLLQSGKTPPSLYEEMWQTIVFGRNFSTDGIINKRKDGSEYRAHLSIYPVRDEGRPLFYIGIQKDITQIQALELARTEFVSIVSHQLRTPLSTVDWYTQMLLTGDVGTLEGKQTKYVQEIKQTVQHMTRLIEALLDVSRLERGTFKVTPQPTNISRIAEDTLEELQPEIQEKSLSIERIFDADIPSFQLDQTLIRVIFQNLLGNAVKYTDERGRVTVEIALKGPDTWMHGEHWIERVLYVRVTDSGIGIPKKEQDRIFTRLFRAENVRERDSQGTGLGLHLVKLIVDQVGGSIWFDSEEGMGTTFHVLIPTTRMEKQAGIRLTQGLEQNVELPTE